MSELAGKFVLVTGAGRGIGKRLAMGFAQAGAAVGLVARSRGELELTQLEIEQMGGSAAIWPADVRDPVAVRAALAGSPPIDVLIHAAGMQGPIGPLWTAAAGPWMETLATNLVGTFHVLQAVLPEMVRRRAGKIVILGGGGSTRSRPGFSAYAASKAGLTRLVETLGDELLHHNVQINTMAPGGTYTSMTDEILQAGDAAGAAEIEDAREVRTTGGMQPERQMGLAMFLASAASNHITGRLIHVKDDWKRLESEALIGDVYTLRRVQRNERPG